MLLMRVLCGVFVLVSLVITAAARTIVTLMSYSWGALSGCFPAPFLLGVRWKGMTAGAWAGIITGLAVVPLMVLGSIGGVLPHAQPAAIGSIAMLLSLAVTPVVSVAARSSCAHIEGVRRSAGNAEVAKARAAEAEA